MRIRAIKFINTLVSCLHFPYLIFQTSSHRDGNRGFTYAAFHYPFEDRTPRDTSYNFLQYCLEGQNFVEHYGMKHCVTGWHKSHHKNSP